MPKNINEKLEWIRVLYGDPMNVFSNLLRSMIVAPKGKVLDCCDYSAIEARVLFWVAKHEKGVQAFRDGRKMYEELAAKIFGVKLESVTSAQRFVGKSATLGAGYQMGWEKFQATCKNFGQDVSDDVAKAAIDAYRSEHAPVKALWSTVERAATAATENPGKKFTVNYTSWYVSGGFLWCVLPSGRRLAYHKPSVRYERRRDKHTGLPFGDMLPRLYHWGEDQKTRKWVEMGTYGGRLVENIVQAIARDIMAAAMLRIEKAGWELVLSVHDELIGERDLLSWNTHQEFCDLMAEVPAWAAGAPIRVEGWEGDRYRK